MQTQHEFTTLVSDIYDCITAPDRWTAVLGHLNRQFDGLVTTMSILDTVNNQARFGAAFGDEAVVRPLITTYAQDMPFFSIIPRMEIDVPVNMQTIYDFAGPNARVMMEQSRLGREWSIPNGIVDALCLALLKHSTHVGTLVISTSDKRKLVQQDELDQLAMLAPHLRRAVTIGDLFEAQKQEVDSYRNIFNALNCAVFIVGADMRLQTANSLAEELLQSGTLMRTTSGFLQCANSTAHKSIVQAAKTSSSSEVALGTLGIGMPITPTLKPAIAHIMPMARRETHQEFSKSAAAAIFISVAGTESVPPIEAISALFGLTVAEKRVASLVAQGMTRSDIAVAGGVSDGTVKTQLDAIFDKTSTGNQRALEQLIRELTPPVKIV